MPYSPLSRSDDDDFSHLPTVDGLVNLPVEDLAETQEVPPADAWDHAAEVGDAGEVAEVGDLWARDEGGEERGTETEEESSATGDEVEVQVEEARPEELPMPETAADSTGLAESQEAAEVEHDAGIEAGGSRTVVGPFEVIEVEAPADNQGEIQHAKKRALLWAAGVHGVVLLILALVQVAPMRQPVSEIVAVSAVEAQEVPTWQKIAPPQPVANSGPSVQPLVATGVSRVVMPEVDFTPTATELNVGSSLGTFGGGSAGAGGAVSFMGNQGRGNRVVFVVDVSGSMSATSQVGNATISRFELLKKELAKSLGQLRGGVQYQVLYFSDFAWPHDEVDSNNATAMENYRWEIRPGQKDARIPSFRYLTANGSSISRSRKIIEESSNPGGTNWGSGLLMALRGNPKPDLIFFMTDGNRSDALTWVDEVTEANSRGKRTVIHTTAMMEPGAAKELDELARRNGGKFTVVKADGKVVKGVDFLKNGDN